MQAGGNGRYSRQILFPPIGERGQEQIRAATVCVVGCGALGSLSAEALVRAGIGRLRVIDRDYVDFSNLQRQWLYGEEDARNEVPKAVAAAVRLRQLNSDVTIDPFVSDVTPSNIEELLEDCALMLDGTDNFETRYLLNDFSVKHGKPWVYGAAIGSYGITMPVDAARGPCFRCVYPESPAGQQPTCDVNGVIAPATATTAAWQVAAAMRLLVGWPDFNCAVHSFDVWAGTSRQMNAGPRDPDCVCCGLRRFEFLDGQRASPVSLCGRNAVQLHVAVKRLDLAALAIGLQAVGDVRVNEFALRVSIPKFDVTVFPDGRAIVKGTTDVAVAKGVYAQLVGA